MAILLSDTLRTARVAVIEATISTPATLQILSGTPPATIIAATSGTLLAEMTLPVDWLSASSVPGVVELLNGPWEELSTPASGTATYYRVFDAGGTAHIQGTVSAVGGGGDMQLNSTEILLNQPVRIVQFQFTEGN
jgi:hypothetical protein